MQRLSKILLIPIIMMAMLPSCRNPKSEKAAVTLPSLQWEKLGQLPGDSSSHPAKAHPGLAGPVAGITGNYLILGGGANFPDSLPWQGGTKKYYDQLYVYQLSQVSNTETAASDTAILLPTTATLPYAVAYPACVSTKAGIVVAGGENGEGPLNKVLLITITMDAAKASPVITALPDLPEASSGGMIASLGSKVYFAGGNTTGGRTSRQFLELDLQDSTHGWVRLPDLPQPIGFGVLYASPQFQSIYLAGGRKANTHARTTFFSTLFSYSIPSQNWHKKSDLPYSVSAATGIPFQDKLYLFGGDQGPTFHKTEDLLLKIAGAKDSTKKQTLIAEKNTLQQHHPGFTHQILAYDLAADRWDLAGNLSFESQVTTTAIPWGNKIIIPCGEIRAGIRYPDIIEGSIPPAE